MTKIGRGFLSFCAALAVLLLANGSFAGETDRAQWIKLGDGQMEAGKYADAVFSFTTALAKGEDTAELRAKRGWAQYMQGSYKVALFDYDEAIKKAPANAAYYNERGLTHHALADYGLAIADFRQSLKLNKTDAVVWANRAESYIRSGDREKAGRDLDQALSLDPNFTSARLQKAWLLINEKQPEKALLELSAIESTTTPDISFLEARAHARLALADWKGASADADSAITIDQQYDWPYLIRTQARRWLGDYEGSLADADRLLVRNRSNMWAMIERAMTLQFLGRTDAALAEMDRAIQEKIDPEQGWRMRAFLNFNAGKMKAALDDARQSATLKPKSPYAVARLGWAFVENGEAAQGEAECGKALTLAETLDAYSCRATARLLLKKFKAARKDAERARDLDKSVGIGPFLIGRVDLAQGNPDKALAQFDQAAKLNMYNQAGLLMYRGDAEKARGNMELARTHYQTARKFDFGRYSQALEERLASLPAQ